MGKPLLKAYKIKEHHELPAFEGDSVIKDKYVCHYTVHQKKPKKVESKGKNVVLIFIALTLLYLKWKKM